MANGQPLVSFSTWVVAANYGSPGAAKVERGVGAMKRGELTPVPPEMDRGQDRASDSVEHDCVRLRAEARQIWGASLA